MRILIIIEWKELVWNFNAMNTYGHYLIPSNNENSRYNINHSHNDSIISDTTIMKH